MSTCINCGQTENANDVIAEAQEIADGLRKALLKAEVGLDAIYPRAHVLKGIRQALAGQSEDWAEINARVESIRDRVTDLTKQRDALAAPLDRLHNAAEIYAAVQDKATDQRIGLVQPVTVDEANELNAALDSSHQALAGQPERSEG